MRNLLIFNVIIWFLLGCGGGDGEPAGQPEGGAEVTAAEHEREVNRWRREREERLMEPYGWLSLVALESLARGTTRVGSDPASDLVVSRGPARWGILESGEDGVRFLDIDQASVRVGGESRADATLRGNGDDGPTVVEADGIQFHLMERGPDWYVRVRDSRAPTRLNFAGLEWFPVDRSWRIDADFEAHAEGSTIEIADVTGYVAHRPNPGAAVFERDGQTHRLEAVESAAGDQLWFILADRTSGRQTYGLGRFLYADLPQDGRITLDFNRAYNPPCAFNENTTCPLPPQENRLDLPVMAGEKAYKGPVRGLPD